jgi:hypothetical protein
MMRRHARLLVCLLCLPVSLSACDTQESEPTSSSGVGGKADELEASSGPIRSINTSVLQAADLLQCAAGNGGHAAGWYDPGAFEPAEVKEWLRAQDELRGCPGHALSISREDGVSQALDFLTNDDMFLASVEDFCESDGIEAVESFPDILTADETVAVFSSRPSAQSDDDPVRCEYHRFLIFQADGTAIELDFDYSD